MEIKKEQNDMENRKVCDVIRKDEAPTNRRCIWILKIKGNGAIKQRLVAYGYD
jgi:hypothetical protein